VLPPFLKQFRLSFLRIHREKGDSYLKEEKTEEKKEEKTEEKPVEASNNEVKEGGTFVVSIEKAPETFNPNAVEKANQMLDEAGLTKNADGIRFETSIDTFGGYDEALKVIQSNFKDMGITLTINTMDDPAYDEKVWFGHNFDLTILGGYQGPDISAMSQRFVTGGGINLGEYSNTELDELFAKGAITSDEAARADSYKQIQKILAKDMPCAFLMEKGALIPTKAYVMNHPRSDEFVDTCTGYDYSHIWLNK